MSQVPPILEFGQRLEARQAAARRSILTLGGVWFAGLLTVAGAAALARNALLSEIAGLFALAAGWGLAATASAGAAFITLRIWPALPGSCRFIGLAPWAVICFVATVVIRGYLP
jgi:hypothetical protein